MLVSQQHTQDGFIEDEYMEDVGSPVRRRRFVKSGLSTYEEFYSRNETGRRLGRYSLHLKLNTERPTITLLLSNCGAKSLQVEKSSLEPSSCRRPRAASDSELDDKTLEPQFNSFDSMYRPSSGAEVVRPKRIATEKFSFFRHRSLPRMSTRTEETRLTEPVDEEFSENNSPIIVAADTVRPSFPLLTKDEEDTDSFPVIQDTLKPFSETSPTRESTTRESFAPRESSFSTDPAYQPVAIRNSVSNNVNVVRFISGFKGTKNQRGVRSSLDSRPSLDSIRKSARNKKQPYVSQELGLNKKLRDARNRIPLEFRDEISHLLQKPFVPKPKTSTKHVQFSTSNEIFVFEWEEEDDGKLRVEESADDVVLMTDGIAENVYIVELDQSSSTVDL